MKVLLLGTGDAGGVPLYGCDCPACKQAQAVRAFRRESCAALVESAGARVLIDAGLTNLTERFAPGDLSAIVLTHFHPDHVIGLFRLRWGRGEPIRVYGPPDRRGCADLFKNPGILDFQRLRKFESVQLGDVALTPLPMIHSKPTFGYAIESASGERFAYLTDTVGLPERTEQFLKRWQPHWAALDCSHAPQSIPPRNHNDLMRALDMAKALAPARVWLTHVGHDLDAWLMKASVQLPPNVSLAWDGAVTTSNTAVSRHGAASENPNRDQGSK